MTYGKSNNNGEVLYEINIKMHDAEGLSIMIKTDAKKPNTKIKASSNARFNVATKTWDKKSVLTLSSKHWYILRTALQPLMSLLSRSSNIKSLSVTCTYGTSKMTIIETGIITNNTLYLEYLDYDGNPLNLEKLNMGVSKSMGKTKRKEKLNIIIEGNHNFCLNIKEDIQRTSTSTKTTTTRKTPVKKSEEPKTDTHVE